MFNDLARSSRVEDQEGQGETPSVGEVLAACHLLKLKSQFLDSFLLPLLFLLLLLLEPQVSLVLRIVCCPLPVANLPIISLMKRKTLLIIAQAMYLSQSQVSIFDQEILLSI